MPPPPLLIATDLGDTAPTVLEAGFWLAARTGAQPLILHVDAQAHLFGESFHAVDPEDLRRMKAAYQGQSLTALRRLVADVAGARTDFEIEVREGRPYEAILAAAEAHAASAIVIGSHAHQGAERFLVGRNAVRVVRDAHRPVYTVDAQKPWRGIERILLASDLSDTTRAAEHEAARLTGLLGASLTLLHVSDLGSSLATPYAVVPSMREALQSSIEERLEGVKLDLAEEATRQGGGAAGVRARLFYATDPAAAIVQVAAEEGSDLVVLGTHGRHGLARALLGSVAEAVLHRANCAVLTARTAPAS